jgi:hypothetical protein
MRYRVLDLTERHNWGDCIARLPVEQQDIYFTPQYYHLYERYSDGQARCFVFESGDEVALYPFLINTINNLGYELERQYVDIQGAYGYNGIICSSYDHHFIKTFYEAFEAYCQQENIVAEFTRFHPLIRNQRFSQGYLEILKNRDTVYLNLEQPLETVWEKEYSGNNRNMIRKASRRGVEVKLSDNPADYEIFFKMYTDTMKNVKADDYYFFSRSYFYDFKDRLAEDQKLILAVYQDRVVAGMLLMIFGRYAHYHLSCREKDESSLGANNLLLHAAVKYARSRGCHYFHFGGGNTTQPTDSLMKFKTNFSRSREEFFIGQRVHHLTVYEDLCRQWECRFPGLKDKYKNFFLKYRMQS